MPKSENEPFKSKIIESLVDNPSPSYEGDSDVSSAFSPEAIHSMKKRQARYILSDNPELETEAGALELARQSQINAAIRAAEEEGIKMPPIPPFVFHPRLRRRASSKRKPKNGAS